MIEQINLLAWFKANRLQIDSKQMLLKLSIFCATLQKRKKIPIDLPLLHIDDISNETYNRNL